MPQMAPLAWTLILYFTIITLILSCVKLFFSHSLSPDQPAPGVPTKSLTPAQPWKW